MANDSILYSWEDLMILDDLDAERVWVRTLDHIRMPIPLKVATELHSLKPQIRDGGTTVAFPLHFTYRVLSLIVEYVTHRQQLRERTYIDLEWVEDWEKNFVQNLVNHGHLLAEFLLAAENLRQESLNAEDRTSMLVTMPDMIYLYGPSERIVDIIATHKPLTTMSRIQTVFKMLSARFTF